MKSENYQKRLSGRGSQQKGKRFEREIAKLINGKRTPQSGGLDIKGDIISLSPPFNGFHFECKNQEKLNIWKALKQSRNDCPGRKIPLVVFTKNFEDTFVAMKFDDLVNLILELEEKNEKQ